MPGKPPHSLPLPDGQRLNLADDGDCLALRLDEQPLLRARRLQHGTGQVLQAVGLRGKLVHLELPLAQLLQCQLQK